MISFSIKVKTQSAVTHEWQIVTLARDFAGEKEGIKVSVSSRFPHEIRIIPPANDKLVTVDYTISINLKNYHQVIVPDTGRTYKSQLDLVDFWSGKWNSRINNIVMPLFILTGLDMYAKCVFGVIGCNYETDFEVMEPTQGRALSAWMKRLTLRIQRGTDDYPIPECVLSDSDNSLVEYIYFQNEDQIPPSQPWLETLRAFAEMMAKVLKKAPHTTRDSLLPYWCSWTDWYSGEVTEDVILENVNAGSRIGIKNYIIDDGWFGPGLDSDFDVDLNIGDWQEDKAKISDLKRLVNNIHDCGGNAILWCAPHAVARHAECFPKREKYLIKNRNNEYLLTYNKFYSLCFMCPEAREIMAKICTDLIDKYHADGAKYDLFNCLPLNTVCGSNTHRHDTGSMIVGLDKTLELITRKTQALKKDYMVELKQNYGTPYFYQYGTTIRAGDTPYCPEGNYFRTAYINGYTPYSQNDYQTITNNDSLAEAASMIIKMMAVGIPGYSINLPNLNKNHLEQLAFFNEWYVRHIDILSNFHRPLLPSLDAWYVPGGKKDIYFLVNQAQALELQEIKYSEILNGAFLKRIYLVLPQKANVKINLMNSQEGCYQRAAYQNVDCIHLSAKTGDIVTITF